MAVCDVLLLLGSQREGQSRQGYAVRHVLAPPESLLAAHDRSWRRWAKIGVLVLAGGKETDL